MSDLCRPVYIPSELLIALGDVEGNWWTDPALEPVICDAIRAWISPARQAGTPQQEATASGGGLQWKQLFLPDGTELRATFDRESLYAMVQDGQLRYGEHVVSPSCFANLHGSGNRNAWQAVWVRFPGNEQWFLADTCRAKQKEAIARLFVNGAAGGEPSSVAKAASPQGQRSDSPTSSTANQQSPRANKAASPGTPLAPKRTEIQPGDGETREGKGAGKGKGGNKRRSRRKWHGKKKYASNPESVASAPPGS